jgi:hypothetical protein
MTEWTNEEEEAFNDVEKHSNLGKQILKDIGQPYHFEVFVSVSQRNQVLEEVAKEFDRRNNGNGFYEPNEPAEIIRGMKK